jgi:hypothetical protein
MNDVRGNAAERFWMFCRGGLSEMEKEMLEGGGIACTHPAHARIPFP